MGDIVSILVLVATVVVVLIERHRQRRDGFEGVREWDRARDVLDR